MASNKLPVSIVVLTHNRRTEVLRTLTRLRGAYPDIPICVVDNASQDKTVEAIQEYFPETRIIALERNLGAAARNHGALAAPTKYIAFCDDDAWWAPDSLARAAAILNRYPALAALTARVLVGPEQRLDATSAVMADSPIPNVLGFPGSEVAGIMAGAVVMRRDAFLAVGGYEPRFFIGGEERLLALDLMAAGWHLGYCPDLVVHHYPSRQRDASGRRRLLLRNALWCAWLRRSLAGAWGETRQLLKEARVDPELRGAFTAALQCLPWILKNRRPVPLAVERRLCLLDGRKH
jgi:GT2 family glycosyltransferase